MSIQIEPIIDHKYYLVNGKAVYKEGHDQWICHKTCTNEDVKAFKIYISIVIENQRFKKHPKATYKKYIFDFLVDW